MNPNILGYLSGLLAVSFMCSQIKHLLRTKKAQGISLLLWQFSLGMQAGWVTYGLKIANNSILIPSIPCVLATIIIIVSYSVYQQKPKKPWWLIFGSSAFLMILFSSLIFYLPNKLVGLVFAVPTAIAQLSQLLKIEFDSDLRGISITMLLLYVFNQSVNLVWGLLISDSVLRLTAISSIILLTISIVTYYYRLKKFYSKKYQ